MNNRLFLYALIMVFFVLLIVGSVQAQLQLEPQLNPGSKRAVAEPNLPQDLASLPGADGDWWPSVQENIRQSEYNLTWQESTYLTDLSAAYQAPNRLHELRTYFTVEGIRVIPRVFDGDTPDWEWGLSLAGVEVAGDIIIDGNRIDYVFGSEDPAFEAWQVNDEDGLKSGYLIHEPTDSLALALSGSLTPHLAEDGLTLVFKNAQGDPILQYGPFRAENQAGEPIPVALRLTAGGFQVQLPKEGDPYSLTIHASLTSLRPDSIQGLSPTPDWTAESDQASAWFGWSVGTAGDVNGDGYSDVVIGAPQYDDGSLGGRVFVYQGSAKGLNAVPSWSAEGGQPSENFGHSVGTAGDVNGDGYSDVIVGAPNYLGGNGAAFVYHGSVSGLSASPDWTAESDKTTANFGYAVGTAGDVNDDGYSDIIIGAPYYENGRVGEGAVFVYHGSATGLVTTASWKEEGNQRNAEFGLSVGTAGDVNGDGYADVIFGSRFYSTSQDFPGKAFVHHGGASGLSTSPNWSFQGDQGDAQYSLSLGTAGDVNGDGYSDVIVGAPLYSNGQAHEGRAFVYHGSSTGLNLSDNWTAESNQGDAAFGFSVGTAGDVNGDGYADVIIGTPDYDNDQTNEGKVEVYFGGSPGLGTAPAWTVEGDQNGTKFGCSVGTAGDVDGDGYSDVIVGAYLFNNGQADEGQAFVYHGGAMGLSPNPSWHAEGNQEHAYFGHAATAGDINGDGFSDVIIGASYYDNGQTDEGRTYLYLGSVAGLSNSPNWTAESNQANTYFGWSVGSAGDVNGDGYSDVIIGAPYYDNEQTNEGRAYVFYGSEDGLSSNPDWIAESDQDGAVFGSSVGTAGDVNGDGFSDVIVGAVLYDNGQFAEGRTFVFHGGPNGLNSLADWTAESDQDETFFGWSVGTAGDVNGDGYSDVIVGTPKFMETLFYEQVGKVFIYYGGANGLSLIADWTAEGNQENGDFGNFVGTAGDVNCDGFSDIIIGENGFDNDQTNEGRAYIYYGARQGLPANPDWISEGDLVGAQFGYPVGSAGDVNGDGYADVIIGAITYSNGQEYEGRAFVFYGNDGGGLSRLPRQLRTDGQTPIDYLGMSDDANAFQVSLFGMMPLGREDVRLHWQAAPLGTPITSTNVISGTGSWTDVGTTGVEINEMVSGLLQGRAYHWRARLQYPPGNALGQPAGPWVTIPINGWNETDLRTYTDNLVPLADAGLDQEVAGVSMVTLDGSGSSDPDGNLPLTYLWTQTGGLPVTLSSQTVISPTFTAPAGSTGLTFSLVVTDSLGLDSDPDEVVISVHGLVFLPLVIR